MIDVVAALLYNNRPTTTTTAAVIVVAGGSPPAAWPPAAPNQRWRCTRLFGYRMMYTATLGKETLRYLQLLLLSATTSVVHLAFSVVSCHCCPPAAAVPRLSR